MKKLLVFNSIYVSGFSIELFIVIDVYLPKVDCEFGFKPQKLVFQIYNYFFIIYKDKKVYSCYNIADIEIFEVNMNYNCQIFTPSRIVVEMLDLINYNDDILDKYMLDNSCGNGNLLIEVVKRYISKALNSGKTKEQISKDLSTYIVGIEIERELVEECKKRLTGIAKDYGINNTDWKIICEDGLSSNFETKFDFIVGNPPYIAYSVLKKEQRQFVKNNFVSCTYGKFDYSYAFIEKCLSLLKDNGKMVFITPSNMYKAQFGRELRKLMLPYVTRIVDYSFEKIFDKVLTSPAITVFEKILSKSLIYELKTEKVQSIRSISKSNFKDKWYFSESESKGKRRFGDFFKVSNSVATLCNNVYVVDKTTIEKYKIEKDTLKVAISPKAQKLNRIEFIIFPYRYIENSYKAICEDEYKRLYPNAYKYLLENKETLQSTNKDNKKKWIEYGRSQALAHLNQPKLLVSTIATQELVIYELSKGQIPYSGLYIVPKKELGLDVAKEILSKKSTMKYLKASGIVLSGTSIRISAKDIANLKF